MTSINEVYNAASKVFWNGSNNTQQPNEPYGEDDPMSGIRVQPEAPDNLSDTDSHEIEPPNTESPLGPNAKPAATPAPDVTPANGDIDSGDSGGGGGGGDDGGSSSKAPSSDPANEADSDARVSKEALRGPSHPAPREEYSFEKEIDNNSVQKTNPQKDIGNTMSSNEHHQGNNARKAIERMKDRFRASGRSMRLGNHANK